VIEVNGHLLSANPEGDEADRSSGRPDNPLAEPNKLE
jgi:hypothetical protein